VKFSVIIPARYASSRLPGKPLAPLCGRPMLQHVCEKALASGANRVLVATDDERISAACEGFGTDVAMTSGDHATGTDRITEVVNQLGLDDDEIVVNLQGDEPLMPAANIAQVAAALDNDSIASMCTSCVETDSVDDLFDVHSVKVIRDENNHAIYFSRAAIPWDRDNFSSGMDSLPTHHSWYRQVGLYAYRAGFLREFINWPVCDLEKTESLEQLRAIWHGRKILVVDALEPPGHGVDTPDDLLRVEKIIAAQLR